eukprot:jgi/Botrbrau1/3331/Bobra.0048s0026.1
MMGFGRTLVQITCAFVRDITRPRYVCYHATSFGNLVEQQLHACTAMCAHPRSTYFSPFNGVLFIKVY